MPTYEYRCTNCDHQLEAFQKMTEAPLTTCPLCHQTSLTKQISPVGIQFKGSGWYLTDYSQKNKSTTETTPVGEQKTGQVSGESTADTKTETKTTAAKAPVVSKDATAKGE